MANAPFPVPGDTTNTWGTGLQSFFGPVFDLNTGKILGAVTPEMFGAKGDGVTDDTTAIVAAANAANASQKVLYLQAKTYAVASVILTGMTGFQIVSNNAILSGLGLSPQSAVLELNNWISSSIQGRLLVEGNNSINYTYGMWVHATTDTTRGHFDGIAFHQNPIGLAIGVYNNDNQCSELAFTHLDFRDVPLTLYVAGSQTGASFAASNLVSETNAAFGAGQYTILMEGGFVTINGGEFVQGSGVVQPAILMQPALTATYHNPYGTLRITGTHIETSGNQLFSIQNPRAFSAPQSSNISFLNIAQSGGYVGAVATNVVGQVTDTTYAGVISAKNNSFNTFNVVRTKQTIDATGNTSVLLDIDKTSFTPAAYLPWINQIIGGVVLHEPVEIIYATNLSSTTGTAATLLWSTIATGGVALDHYASSQMLSAGKVFGIQIPVGGLKYMKISASAKATGGTPTSITIKKNSVADVSGIIVGSQMYVSAEYHDLVAGNQYWIDFTSTGSISFGSTVNQLSIVAGN